MLNLNILYFLPYVIDIISWGEMLHKINGNACLIGNKQKFKFEIDVLIKFLNQLVFDPNL